MKTVSLFQILPELTRVIRVMPNTPSLVKAGASVYSRGSNVIEGDAAMTAELFSSVGICMESPEYLLDAVTGLSGSGPSYVSGVSLWHCKSFCSWFVNTD